MLFLELIPIQKKLTGALTAVAITETFDLNFKAIGEAYQKLKK